MAPLKKKSLTSFDPETSTKELEVPILDDFFGYNGRGMTLTAVSTSWSSSSSFSDDAKSLLHESNEALSSSRYINYLNLRPRSLFRWYSTLFNSSMCSGSNSDGRAIKCSKRYKDTSYRRNLDDESSLRDEWLDALIPEAPKTTSRTKNTISVSAAINSEKTTMMANEVPVVANRLEALPSQIASTAVVVEFSPRFEMFHVEAESVMWDPNELVDVPFPFSSNPQQQQADTQSRQQSADAADNFMKWCTNSDQLKPMQLSSVSSSDTSLPAGKTTKSSLPPNIHRSRPAKKIATEFDVANAAVPKVIATAVATPSTTPSPKKIEAASQSESQSMPFVKDSARIPIAAKKLTPKVASVKLPSTMPSDLPPQVISIKPSVSLSTSLSFIQNEEYGHHAPETLEELKKDMLRIKQTSNKSGLIVQISFSSMDMAIESSQTNDDEISISNTKDETYSFIGADYSFGADAE